MQVPTPTAATTSQEIVISDLLPHENIYTIQAGTKKYQLSGASLSYDSPSYFTDYFTANPTSVLNFDRSPEVFDKIYMHLQGYCISIADEYEFVYLLFDAHYFKLPKLRQRLIREPLIMMVGGRRFRVPHELLTQKGNHPNYFSVVHDSIMTDPFSVSKHLIRPPPASPYEANNSADIFQDLLDSLRGLRVEVRNEDHRANLIADCRYYQFFGLEQKFIKHQIRRNPFTNTEEIVIGYADVKKNGLLNDTMNTIIGAHDPYTVVKYKRPFVDTVFRDLVIQLESSEVSLMVNTTLVFYNLLIVGKTAVKLKNIIAKVSDDYMYEVEQGVEKLTVLIRMTDSVGKLNNLRMEKGWLDTLISVNKESVDANTDPTNKIIVVKLMRSQWTINVQGRNKIWMDCLKFDGVLDVSHFNETRDFL